MTDIRLVPMDLKRANAWIDEVHRHHEPVRGHRFSVGVVDFADRLHGVGIAGRPKSKALQQQGYIEIVRIATDGTSNACSMLYGALRRAAVALGYEPHKIVTYILEDEPGTSLRAAGFIFDGLTEGGSWDRPSRPRRDTAPTGPKQRWLAARRPTERTP